MTEHKHLKQRVRARMAKTGERYAAAREHVTGRTDRQTHHRGVVAECTALAALLGGQLSEPMLFGIAGGIGAAYWVFEYKELPAPLVTIMTRHAWDSSQRFLVEACHRLGVATTVRETSSAGQAQRQLDEALAGGKAAIAWVARTLMPDNAMPPEMAAMAPHAVLVRKATADGYELDDRGSRFEVGREALTAARATVRTERHRLLTVDGTGTRELKESAREGIRACIAEMRTASPHLPRMAAPNSGLAGLHKWAQLLADSKDRRGWPRLFPDGAALHTGLTAIHRWVELAGPGALRGLYAEFLNEAGFAGAAQRYRQLGRDWTTLAQTAISFEVQREELLQRLASQVAQLARDEELALDALERELGTPRPT